MRESEGKLRRGRGRKEGRREERKGGRKRERKEGMKRKEKADEDDIDENTCSVRPCCLGTPAEFKFFLDI